MDASCCLQESIHLLELNQLSMCPEIWVHIKEGIIMSSILCNSVTKSVISVLILEVYQMLLTIESSKLRLLDLTCSITKDRCEDDLSGSLISGKL